jgi:hypothetical protein
MDLTRAQLLLLLLLLDALPLPSRISRREAVSARKNMHPASR